MAERRKYLKTPFENRLTIFTVRTFLWPKDRQSFSVVQAGCCSVRHLMDEWPCNDNKKAESNMLGLFPYYVVKG